MATSFRLRDVLSSDIKPTNKHTTFACLKFSTALSSVLTVMDHYTDYAQGKFNIHLDIDCWLNLCS